MTHKPHPSTPSKKKGNRSTPPAGASWTFWPTTGHWEASRPRWTWAVTLPETNSKSTWTWMAKEDDRFLLGHFGRFSGANWAVSFREGTWPKKHHGLMRWVTSTAIHLLTDAKAKVGMIPLEGLILEIPFEVFFRCLLLEYTPYKQQHCIFVASGNCTFKKKDFNFHSFQSPKIIKWYSSSTFTDASFKPQKRNA